MPLVTKPVLRIPERVIPTQDVEIRSVVIQPSSIIDVMLTDGRNVQLPLDVETSAFLNHLYVRIAGASSDGTEKIDVPVAEASIDVAVDN